MSTVDQAAALLLSIRRGQMARPVSLPVAIAPQSESDAYAIQQSLMRMLGEDIGGWKASMPDAVSGFSAPIAASAVLSSPAATVPAAVATRGANRFGIEPEIAFRMARDLTPRVDAAYSRDEVLAAVASAHAAIELCVCRLADFERAPTFDRLADGIMNEGLVIGPACAAWQSLPLSLLPLRVEVDAVAVHEGIGGHPIVDPVIPLVWMANHLSARGITLRAGQVITTGSCNGIRFVGTGQRVRIDFGGLGNASVSF